MAWGGRVSGWLNDLGHGTSSEYVDSLLVTRWKADAYVVLTPPSALPNMGLAHTRTRAWWMTQWMRATMLLFFPFFAMSSAV